MNSFMTKPYYQQLNDVNQKLNNLRRANLEILKDQIENPVISEYYRTTTG